MRNEVGCTQYLCGVTVASFPGSFPLMKVTNAAWPRIEVRGCNIVTFLVAKRGGTLDLYKLILHFHNWLAECVQLIDTYNQLLVPCLFMKHSEGAYLAQCMIWYAYVVCLTHVYLHVYRQNNCSTKTCSCGASNLSCCKKGWGTLN